MKSPASPRSQLAKLTAAAKPGKARSAVARCFGAGKSFARPGDHAQRAFGATEQLAQLVAGIVLLHRAEPFHTSPSAVTTSSPSTRSCAYPIAEVAAPGIGSNQPAYARAAFGAEMQRKDQAVRLQRVMKRSEHGASLDENRSAFKVGLADRRHAGKRQDHRVRPVRDGAAAKAGVSALRHDGQIQLSAETDKFSGFGRARRTRYPDWWGHVPVKPVPTIRSGVFAESQPFGPSSAANRFARSLIAQPYLRRDALQRFSSADQRSEPGSKAPIAVSRAKGALLAKRTGDRSASPARPASRAALRRL